MESTGSKRLRIDILAEKMGQGHMSVSRALVAGLEQAFPGQYDIEITDISSLMGRPLLDRVFLAVHRYVSRALPGLYSRLFQLGNVLWLVRLTNQFASPVAKAKIRRFINTNQPDIVISTFPTWNPLIARLYKAAYPKRKFIVVVTDLVYAQGVWLSSLQADAIIVGNPETKEHLEKFGQLQDRIKVLGYPTQPKLLEPVDAGVVLAKIHLDPKAFTVLYLVSVESSEEVQGVIDELEKVFPDDNVIVACGRNEAMLAALKTNRPGHTALVGWTDAMADFLRTSKLVLGKAGGASVMECMTTGKPLVITRAVAGEEGNAEIVKKYGYGLVLKNHEPKTVSNAVAEIKADYPAYNSRLQKFPYRDATKEIARYIDQTLKETL